MSKLNLSNFAKNISAKLGANAPGITIGLGTGAILVAGVNSHDSIAVVSYIDRDGRKRENSEKEPYKAAITYEKPYTENMTNEEAYAYLKTLPEFEGSEDV